MVAGEQVSVQHPLSWEGFQLGLQDCPNRELVQFVLHAIENGAALGTAKNHLSKDPFRCRNGCMGESEVRALCEEVAQGLQAQHKISPFAEPPFASSQCSPVNAIPKKGTDKFWLIHNLSHPFGGESVNSLVSPEEARVSYQKFDEFVDQVRHAGRGDELGKFDLADAYKSVLVDPIFWHLLGLHADEPAGGRQFFMDVSLPFGH